MLDFPLPFQGLISEDELPIQYKHMMKYSGKPYGYYLEKSVGFSNPHNVSYLSGVMGILDSKPLSMMRGLRGLVQEVLYSLYINNQHQFSFIQRFMLKFPVVKMDYSWLLAPHLEKFGSGMLMYKMFFTN